MPRHVGSCGHQRGALRDGEDEDEIEEQLERADPLALAEHHPHTGQMGVRRAHAPKSDRSGGL